MEKSILIISNQQDILGRLGARFRDSGYDVSKATWRESAEASLADYSAVIFDCRSKDGLDEKLDVVRREAGGNSLVILSDDTFRSRDRFKEVATALIDWSEEPSVFLAQVAGMIRKKDPERCLILEDETEIAQKLASLLSGRGYEVTVAGDMRSAREAIEAREYAVLLLDRAVPAEPGVSARADALDLLRELRERDFKVPALFVSARTDLEERIKGRKAGANDYIVKPFDDEELLVRIELLLSPRKEQEVTTFGSLEMHARDRIVRWKGERIMLTEREFRLFHYLCVRRGIVIPVPMLRADVWDTLQENSSAKNMVVSAVRFLRKKLRDAQVPEIIFTEKSDGYVFDASALLELQGGGA